MMADLNFPKQYCIQGDSLIVDEELHFTLNVLAGRFYQILGYKHINGFDYSTSLHPQEQNMYAMALEAAYLQQTSGGLDS